MNTFAALGGPVAHLPPQVHITRADTPRATLASLGAAPPPDVAIPPSLGPRCFKSLSH